MTNLPHESIINKEYFKGNEKEEYIRKSPREKYPLAGRYFEDGIMECADKEIIVLDNVVFSGAYTIAKDKAAIFVVDDHGVGEVVELHLIHKSDGDILCECEDGNEIVWFYRNRESIDNEK